MAKKIKTKKEEIIEEIKIEETKIEENYHVVKSNLRFNGKLYSKGDKVFGLGIKDVETLKKIGVI